jgi:hypothetical protein
VIVDNNDHGLHTLHRLLYGIQTNLQEEPDLVIDDDDR